MTRGFAGCAKPSWRPNASGPRRAVAGSADVHEQVLDERETEVLLRLLDAASTAWVPVSGRVGGTTGSDSGVTLTVSAHSGSTVVRTAAGMLHLNNRKLEVRQTTRAAAREVATGTEGDRA